MIRPSAPRVKPSMVTPSMPGAPERARTRIQPAESPGTPTIERKTAPFPSFGHLNPVDRDIRLYFLYDFEPPAARSGSVPSEDRRCLHPVETCRTLRERSIGYNGGVQHPLRDGSGSKLITCSSVLDSVQHPLRDGSGSKPRGDGHAHGESFSIPSAMEADQNRFRFSSW